MDAGADTTQKIVIAASIFLGIAVVLIIGYSLYNKAKTAEGQLANKIALEAKVKRNPEVAGISLTGESRNRSIITYDGLVQRRQEPNQVATTTSPDALNTKIEPDPEPAPQGEPEEIIEEFPEEKTPPPPKVDKPAPEDDDRPLTYEEIVRIRQLPIEDSPAGNLQTALEIESRGEYRARY